MKHVTRGLVIALIFWRHMALCGDIERGAISDVSTWIEEICPPATEKDARARWLEAASSPPVDWRVFLKDGKVCAEYSRETAQELPEGLKPDLFRRVDKFKQVDNGWLVARNYGEFGAALYWFSSRGETNYLISNHHVVDFISFPDCIYAIEGLAHMGGSHGSLIRIGYSKPDGRWKAASVFELPFAPFAVSQRRDGTMLITLSDSLVAIGRDHELHTLVANAGWNGLDPGSSVLTGDERKLYIGMRQFVGEFDLKSNKMRFLVPSKDWR